MCCWIIRGLNMLSFKLHTVWSFFARLEKRPKIYTTVLKLYNYIHRGILQSLKTSMDETQNVEIEPLKMVQGRDNQVIRMPS